RRDRSRQRRVAGHRLSDEGERRRPSLDRADGGGDARRVDVDDAVAEPRRGSGPAVVHLVGVEHDDLPRQATLHPSAIVEGLNAGLGDTDGVGVVAMPLVSAPPEPSAQQPAASPGAGAPAPAPADARTYKPLARRSPHYGDHAASLLEARGGDAMKPEQAIAFFVFSVAAAG